MYRWAYDGDDFKGSRSELLKQLGLNITAASAAEIKQAKAARHTKETMQLYWWSTEAVNKLKERLRSKHAAADPARSIPTDKGHLLVELAIASSFNVDPQEAALFEKADRKLVDFAVNLATVRKTRQPKTTPEAVTFVYQAMLSDPKVKEQYDQLRKRKQRKKPSKRSRCPEDDDEIEQDDDGNDVDANRPSNIPSGQAPQPFWAGRRQYTTANKTNKKKVADQEVVVSVPGRYKVGDTVAVAMDVADLEEAVSSRSELDPEKHWIPMRILAERWAVTSKVAQRHYQVQWVGSGNVKSFGLADEFDSHQAKPYKEALGEWKGKCSQQKQQFPMPKPNSQATAKMKYTSRSF
jgi:hypothetical protein